MKSDLAYRASVFGRLLIAAVGGYALAAVSTALLSLTLPLDRSEAVTTATLLSFVILAVAALYAFAARTLGRAALGIGLPLAALGGVLWLVLLHVQAGGPA